MQTADKPQNAPVYLSVSVVTTCDSTSGWYSAASASSKLWDSRYAVYNLTCARHLVKISTDSEGFLLEIMCFHVSVFSRALLSST